MPAERLLQQDTSNLSLLLCSPAPQDMILPFSTRLLAKKLLPRNHCLWFHLGSPSYWRCVPSAREVRRRQASCGCSWDLQENLKSLENALVVEPRWPLLTSANGCQTKLGFAMNAQVAQILWRHSTGRATIEQASVVPISSVFSKLWEGERDPPVTFKMQRLSTERNKFLTKTIACLSV